MAQRRASKELRELVVYQAEKLGWTTRQIAEALNIGIRTVQQVKKLHHDEGVVLKSHGPLGRPKLMSKAHVNVSSSSFL